MLDVFRQITEKYTGKKILLAISGGMDSVVLAHLCQQTGLHFEMAHCNFHLRGKESDTDEKFVQDLAQKLNVKLHIKQCAVSKNQNTQIAARTARYNWFVQLKTEYNFDYIFTAHHLNDSIETFLINLIRTTGIKGLLGITENEIYKRPLLQFTRNEIKNYATANDLKWRDDSSNASDVYLRNYIRHHIVPEFKKLKPEFEKNMQKTFELLQQDYQIIDNWFQEKKKQWTFYKKNDLWIDTKIIEHPESFLFRLLSPYQFTDWKAINKLLNAQSGKYIKSNTHLLTKYQHYLIVSKLPENEAGIFYIDSINSQIKLPFALSMQMIAKEKMDWKSIKTAEKNEIYVDLDKISFPIIIRKWEAGDYFYPLGMQGKKKVSDFLTNLKIPLFEKQKIWLFCNRKKIMWVAGYRADNRFKITDKTKQILHIKID